MLGNDPNDPASVVTSRESIRLALIAALQHLPPRQRAVLVLRDVLRWKAAEVAEALDTSVPAVNSILQRARAQLEAAQLTEDSIVEPDDAALRALLDRWVEAFWQKDINAIVDMFSKDAIWEMPPFVGWYQGPDEIGRLIDRQCPGGVHDMRMVLTQANGQPAFGLYMRTDAGDFEPFHLQVLTIGAEGVSHVAAFFELELFSTFGLPERLPADYAA